MASNKERQRIIEFMAEYLKNKTYFSYKIIRVAYLNKYFRNYNNFQIIEIKKEIGSHLRIIFSKLGTNKLLVKYSKLVYIVNKELMNFLNSQISSCQP